MNQAATLQVAKKPLNLAPWVTTLILAALTAYLLWRGWGFYRQDLALRPEHKDYASLRPAGLVGHGYGIVGTGLILTNLLYLVRRRFAKYIPSWMGSMKRWLDIHVVTGLGGALLILFHSAFQVRTAIAAVTAVSLSIVVVTGIVGLYLYALIPKAGLKPLKDRLAELQPLLPGLVKNIEEWVAKVPATKLPANASLFRTIFTMPRWMFEARARRHIVAVAARKDKLLRVLMHNEPKLAKALVAELGDLAAGEVDTNAGAAFMRSWRSIHRFLALLMVVSVTVHIGVAWFYGFRWIFS